MLTAPSDSKESFKTKDLKNYAILWVVLLFFYSGKAQFPSNDIHVHLIHNSFLQNEVSLSDAFVIELLRLF